MMEQRVFNQPLPPMPIYNPNKNYNDAYWSLFCQNESILAKLKIFLFPETLTSRKYLISKSNMNTGTTTSAIMTRKTNIKRISERSTSADTLPK
jgi:hypothetical protein